MSAANTHYLIREAAQGPPANKPGATNKQWCLHKDPFNEADRLVSATDSLTGALLLFHYSPPLFMSLTRLL